jgi:zinc transport system substrate-binding protein
VITKAAFNFREVILKKIILIILTLAAALCVPACRQERQTAVGNSDGRINITTTNFPPYDFVRSIAGDRVNLTMLLPPGSESHSFEPSPRDIITVQNSDLFIYVGGESEDWVERILKSMNKDKTKTLAMMDVVEVVEEEIVEGMEEEDDDQDSENSDNFFVRLIKRLFNRDSEDEGPEYDEHVWTSPLNAILIVRAITEQLCDVDSANAAYYRRNAASYIEELTELDASFREVTANAKRKTIVFADRFPFRYFADTYGLQYFAAFPGCSTETEPSVATVRFLIDKIKNEQIPVVFHIELSNERMADTISAETGAKKLLLHACHNITKSDFDLRLGYLDFMRRNVENLRQALY